MKRKLVYIGICVLLIGSVAGIRIIHEQKGKENGKLGEKIVVSNGEKSSPKQDWEEITLDQGESSEKKDEKKKESLEPLEKKQVTEGNISTPSALTYKKITSKSKVKTYDTGTAVIGNAGYELYTYVDSAASNYTDVINHFSKKLGKKVSLYEMIAPTSAGITLPDNKIKKVNTSSQKKALKKMEKKIHGTVKFVPLCDPLMGHRTEYIYFRTDHHWTAKGAYYAYEAFCKKKGIVPHSLQEYKKTKAKGFLGSFYRDANKNKSLKKDTVEMYQPLSAKLKMKYITPEGQKGSAPVVADANQYGTSLKYCAFLAGDNAYSVIKNKEITDGSSCVVIKESYGNAFVPYLTDHYETVYVIDYRYWKGKAAGFIKKKKVKDVVILNNISMTRNTYLIGKLKQVCR